MSRYINENRAQDIICGGICCVLPPAFSTLFSFFCFVATKRRIFGYFFFVFATLLLTYLFFSYDTASRFWYTMPGKIDWSMFWVDDFLSTLTRLFRNHGASFISVFYLYYLLIFLIWYKVFFRCCDNIPLGLSLVTLMAFGVGLRDAIDLTYYTLAVLLSLFFFTRQRGSSINIVWALLAVFLVHRGALMVVLPAIVLYYILKKGNAIYYWLFLSLFFASTFLFDNLNLSYTGNPIVDTFLDSYGIYTSDSFFWGRRNYEIAGIAMFISFYLRTAWFVIVFILTVIHRNSIKQKFVLAVFQCGFTMLPNFWSYQLFTERTMVAMSFTSVLCVLMLIDSRVLKLSYLKVLAALVFVFYCFNVFRGERLPLKSVFTPGSYSSITSRSLYVPSIVLFDYDDFGFSDDFVLNNCTYYIDR